MTGLPHRPDLNQLRRQAKELHRAAVAGEREGVRRLGAVSARTTLAAAQLAVAREHGFTSWPSLRTGVEAAGATPASPLMSDKHRRTAVDDAADFLARTQQRGWRPGTLPVGVVFTSQTFITVHLAGAEDRYQPSDSLTPTNGQVFLTVGGPPVAVACLGVGAPAVVTLLEHLVALGVRSFIAVGPAPAVATDLRWGDYVVIDRALRDDGVSSHYAAPARYAAADTGLTARLVAAVEAEDLEVRTGSSWTVPTPYRTTEEELSAYQEEGVLVTEMTTAALFAAARALGARAASAVMATTTPGARAATSAPAPERRSGQVLRLVETAVGVLQQEQASV